VIEVVDDIFIHERRPGTCSSSENAADEIGIQTTSERPDWSLPAPHSGARVSTTPPLAAAHRRPP
jgi:hypothetical protein